MYPGAAVPAIREDRLEASRRLEAWLNARCGMHFPEADLDVMAQRLSRVAEQFGLHGLEALVSEIERGNNQEIEAAVVHAASTNHTYFFRETDTLDYFRSEILHSLASEDEIRMWSAAASTGDEAYTCAMIAAETMDGGLAQQKLRVLGTDISGPVIETAEAAVYRPSSLEHVPPHMRARFMNPVGDGRFAVADEIRRMCTFRRMNLKLKPYPFQKRFHIVLCRNVLYYFRPETQREVLEEIYEVTTPEGWLLTDVSCSLRDLGVRWVPVKSGVYRKRA